jgi:dihydroorotate dehydrogenase electron transfer subunit
VTPVQERAEIFAVQRVGDYLQFTVIAPGIARAARPGQFVAVAVGGENTAMILRRAFALFSATPGGDFAGTVQFVVAEHGPGTRWLMRRRAGDTLDLVGPLGTPFPLPAGPAGAVLVGGGYGTAPLVPLASALRENGSDVEFVIGAATASRLFGELAAKRVSGLVTVTTDDGSAGIKGRRRGVHGLRHRRVHDVRAARRRCRRRVALRPLVCGGARLRRCARALGRRRNPAARPRRRRRDGSALTWRT